MTDRLSIPPALTLTVLLMLLLAAAPLRADDTLADRIRTGDRDGALALLEAGADVNAATGDGSTALLWAVYQLDRDLVRRLLSREADPDALNNFGAGPLSEAVKAADAELVDLLLAAGADVEAANDDGQTALMLAARTGDVAVAERLLAHGASPDARERWREQTALMWAADSGHGAMSRLLIEHGARVDARARIFDWDSQITAEPRAQYRPSGGMTPLLYTARSGCLPCIEAIIEAGADIDLPNPDGVTPLMVAIDNFNFDAAARLLAHGANPHAWDWWGRTALYIAVDMHSFTPRSGPTPDPDQAHDALDIARQLLDAGANPDSQLNMHRPGRGGNSGRFTDDMLTSGATPLLRAADTHDLAAVRLLLEYGARVDLPNVMGVTPFMAAAGFGAERGRLIRGHYPPGTEDKALPVLKILLEAGADVNARIQDTTSHNARIARLSSMTDRQGQTALFAAAKQDWPRVVRFLLDNGAVLRARDERGRNALDAALGDAGGRVERPVEETPALLEELGLEPYEQRRRAAMAE